MMHRRGWLALVVALPLAGCGEDPVPAGPQTEFVTARRPWLPGERDSMIARIVRTRQLALPYVGDLSDNAGELLPLDSVTEIVANPLWVSASYRSPLGPSFALTGLRVPGTGWTTFGLDIRTVNNNQGADTFDWLGAIWFSNADSTWKGIILAAGAGTTLPATTVNTTNFDAANAKIGAGGGEFRFSNATTWLANGSGAPNQFSVALSLWFGAVTTVTTGPYLGGTSRTGLMSININNVGLTRVSGAGAPATQTASVSGFVGAVQLICVFPSPCTTNVPIMAASRKAVLQ